MDEPNKKPQYGSPVIYGSLVITTVAALLGALATVIAAVVVRSSTVALTATPSTPIALTYTGRVIDATDGRPIHRAKVTLEFQNPPPIVIYTDSEGVFAFLAPFSDLGVPLRISIQALGYGEFDRFVTLGAVYLRREMRECIPMA
jgi:hypothetical protein